MLFPADGGAVPSYDRPFFRRSGLPVQMIRPERGCMLLCVCGWDRLMPLLSPLLSAPHRVRTKRHKVNV